ncbi:ABC transporter ATP-binding protein [Salana multivorans]|uniref:ABC transporter ATP-binding protein n=1 Tax=Salana multivorans TaxID=120377 RepID=UPI000B01B5C9|nr:ABC transporter ATP-binding protein [Salana multivorans]
MSPETHGPEAHGPGDSPGTRRERRERARAAVAPVLVAERLSRVFPTPAGDVVAVADVSLDLRPGELVALRGPSGSGKTTLLNLLGGLDEPTSGTVRVDGQDLADLDESARLALRRTTLAFVFQAFGLIGDLTARENVEVPLRLRGTPPTERDLRVDAVLGAVGLAPHAHQRPGELSGGQQQRVGIARAIVAEPRLLLADEPTGQLDSTTGTEIMELLAEVVHARGLAALVATHDPLMLERADRVLRLRDGRLVDD